MAFADLGARHMLAVHYDTFVNSLDEYGEAPRVLRSLLPGHGLDEERVAILAHGEQRVFLAH
jgi:L-ascorbate metabolism protein UlaG (beta-lactamase superfamily)